MDSEAKCCDEEVEEVSRLMQCVRDAHEIVCMLNELKEITTSKMNRIFGGNPVPENKGKDELVKDPHADIDKLQSSFEEMGIHITSIRNDISRL